MHGISISKISILAAFMTFGAANAAEPEPAPYLLTASELAKYKGTFGISLSHYDFDRDAGNPACQSQPAYNTPACSCTINWKTISDSGLKYAYSKATEGVDNDLSFARSWSELESLHARRTLLRGAYHFLRPGIDAKLQADAFLRAIGAVNGKKPAQLPPILDIEWSKKTVTEGSPEFTACPRNRLEKKGDGTYRCDMWYTMSAEQIAALAKKWIELVEAATGRPVIIYTNTGGWWNGNMGRSGEALVKKRAVWLSAYPLPGGPVYHPNWTDRNGSLKWQMPPLPMGVSYRQDSYDVAHFWQFTEKGSLPKNVRTCGGRSKPREMEFNWIPVAGKQFRKVFSVSGQ